MQGSLRRKLAALGHPAPDKVDPNDEEQFRRTVVWLEDQKIRHLGIDERAGLREVASPGWPAALATYLTRLACPLAPEGAPGPLLSWLLGLAVRLEWGEGQGAGGRTGAGVSLEGPGWEEEVVLT